MANRLCHRLDAEPPIFWGCTTSELGVILGASVLFWLPTGFLLAGMIRAWTLGVGIAALGILGTVIVAARLFQRLKRNRPEAYYWHRVLIALHRYGLKRSPFHLRHGVWDVGREP